MRFLLVNRFFGGQQTPTGRMVRDVAIELRQLGHEVTVLVSQSSYAGAQGTGELNEQQFCLRHVRELKAGRVAAWGSFWLRAIFSLASKRWDRCLLLTDPPFLPFAAWLTRHCRTSEQRLYWWTMDIYPEALAAAGRVNERGWFYRRLRHLNELGFQSLTGVIALGSRQLKRLQTYQGWNNEASFATIVPPWDLRPIHQETTPAKPVSNRFAGQGKKIALYAGNLGEGHLFMPFVAAARLLHSHQRTDWLFVFVTRGSGRPALAAAAAGLPNVCIIDYLPEAETGALLGSATAHLVSMKAGWEGIIVPSKLYGVLQTSAPVLFLGPLDSDTAEEIQKSGRGLSLPPATSGEDVAGALDELAKPRWVQKPHCDSLGPRRVAEFITR